MYKFNYEINLKIANRVYEDVEKLTEISSNNYELKWKYSPDILKIEKNNEEYTISAPIGYCTIGINGNEISIISGEYMGRKCKAESRLKANFLQIALRIYSLKSIGKIA